MITTHSEIPKGSLLNKQGGSYDYIDSFQSIIDTEGRTDDISVFLNLFIHSGPKWADYLLAIRDKVVGIFGLKTKEQISEKQKGIADYTVGEQIGIFKLFDKTENEFLLGDDDKHLNFRVSLLLDQIGSDTTKRRLSITTAVNFNNIFGKLYFLPVKPFHRLIVRASLKNIVKQYEKSIKGSN
jgi:hypothetical protein